MTMSSLLQRASYRSLAFAVVLFAMLLAGAESRVNASSGHIYAYYDQGFARRHVWAKMSQYRPGQLWVYTYTDFTDPNRPDYDVHNWFRK
jgi:hypothetical protein